MVRYIVGLRLKYKHLNIFWLWYFHGYFYDMMGTYIYVLLHVVKQIQVLRFLKMMSVKC